MTYPAFYQPQFAQENRLNSQVANLHPQQMELTSTPELRQLIRGDMMGMELTLKSLQLGER
jgi:hypothetical protein